MCVWGEGGGTRFDGNLVCGGFVREGVSTEQLICVSSEQGEAVQLCKGKRFIRAKAAAS